MRKIILFNQTDNLYRYINQFATSNKETLIITPSPNYSDMLRSKLVAHHRGFKVITVAKFIRDELKALFDDEILGNFKGKSELLLELSSVFKRMFPHEDYAFFEQSFTLLTDFRSFSLNADVLESILDNYPPKMKHAVLGMHQVLESLGYFDEHKSYFTLSERLRAGDLPIEYQAEKELIFYGFDFLAPSQVDLLKSYSIRSNVYIPVYESVYAKKSHLDWVEWVQCDESQKIDKPRELENLQVKTYPKNYLSKVLKKEISQIDEQTQLLLSQKKLNIETLVMSSIDHVHVKIPMEFMQEDVINVYEILKKKLKQRDLSELFIELSSKALKNEDFKQYKVISLFNDTYNEWLSIKGDDDILSEFNLKIFKEVVLLDLPRVSLLSTNTKNKIKLFDLQNIESIEEGKPLYFALASQFSNFKSSVTPYLEGVEKYLATIGPIRNSELEKQVILAKVRNILAYNKLTVLLEDGLVEEDIDISSLFNDESSHFEKANLDLEKKTQYPEYKKVDNFEFIPSATSLQTYIDCPRQFRLKYIEGFQRITTYTDKLNKLELGRIEHAVIEKFVKKHDRYNEDDLKSLIDYEITNSFRDKELKSASLSEVRVEVESLTRPIIEKLFKLIHTGKFKVDFEINLDDKNVKGSIDCVLRSDEEIFLLDFKRGEFSIPSKKDFLDFAKLQVWFYLNHFANPQDTPMTFGYVNLSQNDKSLLFSNYDNTSLLAELLETKQYQIEDFPGVMSEYKSFEIETTQRIQADRNFIPQARKTLICEYCEFANYCEKMERV